MVTDKKIKELENSAVELTVTVPEKEVKKSYDALVKKYCKTAQVKGFRKGKVPPSVLEKKYGEALRQEAAMELIDQSLKEAIDEVEEQHKPLPYSQPALKDEENLDMELKGDFSYTVTYDVAPNFEVTEYKGLEVEVPEVTVDEEEFNKEIEKLQDQNALVVDKDGKVEKDDIVTVDYAELDEDGNEKEDTKREDYVFTVGTGYNLYKFDDDIIGMEKGEEKIIEKDYPEDHEDSHLAGKQITLKVAVKAVKQRDIPELDDDFAQDISEKYETLQDLKDDISKRLQNDLDQKLKEYKINNIIMQIIEKTPFDIPNSMVQAQLEDSWKNFAQNSGIPEEQLEQILQMQGKSKQNIMDEWKDQAVNSLKSNLIMNKIIENEQLDASDEELEKLKEEKKDQLPEDPQQQKYMEFMLKEQIKNDKAADLLLENAVLKTGEKKSYKEFMQNTVD